MVDELNDSIITKNNIIMKKENKVNNQIAKFRKSFYDLKSIKIFPNSVALDHFDQKKSINCLRQMIDQGVDPINFLNANRFN